MAEKDLKSKTAAKSETAPKSKSTTKDNTAAAKPKTTAKNDKPAAKSPAKSAKDETKKVSSSSAAEKTEKSGSAKPKTSESAQKKTSAQKHTDTNESAAVQKTTAKKAPEADATAKTAKNESGVSKPASESNDKSTDAKNNVKSDTAKIPKNDSAIKETEAPKPSDKKKNAVKKRKKLPKTQTKATVKQKKQRIIIFSAIAAVLVLTLILSIVFGLKSCTKDNDNFNPDIPPEVLPPTILPDDPENPGDLVVIPELTDKPLSSSSQVLSPIDFSDPAIAEILKDAYKYEYPSTSVVGFNSKITGTVDRKLSTAEKSDGTPITNESELFPLGIETPANQPRYPQYGSNLGYVLGDAGADARTALINESDYVTAYGTRNNSGNGNNGDGSYNKMDKDGYLYFVNGGTERAATNPDGSHRKLYKHDAAMGLYFEGVGGTPYISDTQDRVIKEVTIRPRGYSSYSVTGLYAPAGEVIKIKLSEADMEATGGITIHIGQALYNGQSNNIWTAKGIMNRFPNILNTMTVNKSTATYDEATHTYTAYVGSFVGGPIYIRNTSKTFTAEISGGINYLHFILGYTTKEEFEEIKETTTAPYFDLEVWNYGVLLSGPVYYAKNFSYEELYKVATLWEKVASVTTTGSNQGIVFLFDSFVAAGAAVAFPGRSSVNCPAGWMTQALNYNSIVTSGAWGNFHEYHHNFQGYGVGNGGEVTNNGMTLVSYALFTKISSSRGIGTFGAQGLGGWNSYTSATWALNEVLKIADGGTPSNGKQGLTLYATLLHNFGANNYIQAKYAQQKGGFGQSYTGYMRAWEEVTHNNMSYFFKDILQGIDDAGLTNIENTEWHKANAESSMFVPVSCVYQTGRSFMYDGAKKYFKTMRPYLIKAGESFNIDLSAYNAPSGQYQSGSIIIPKGFSYRVKSITEPINGTIELVDNLNFKYTPAEGARTGSTSGQIIVTLEIVKNDGAFKVDDVDLILEFEISQEINRMTLERTTYTYTADTMYEDAVEAFKANFAGYQSASEKWDHSNPTQNCNTDIWYYLDSNASSFPNADPEKHKIKDNAIEVIEGKLYFDADGKFRVYLRGRKNCAVYFSLDGKEYKLGARITNGSGAAFYTNNSNTYFDVLFNEGNVTVTVYCEGETTEYKYTIEANSNHEIINWLYFKEILIVKESERSFIGLGMQKWTETMFTMEETYHTATGATQITNADNIIEQITPEHEQYAYTKTTYKNYQGNQAAYIKRNKDGTVQYFKTVGSNHNVASTSEELAALTLSQMIEPTAAAYVNAYRKSYDFPDNKSFESDYFYTRSYNYNYVGNTEVITSKYTQTYMSEISNYKPWDNDDTKHNIQNLFDGNLATTVHTHNNFYLSESNPLIIAFDMGQTVIANALTMTVYPGPNGGRAFPKVLLLEGSLDGENWFEMGKWSSLSSGAHSGKPLAFPDKEFRYYKITVTKSNYDITERFALSELSLSYALRLNGNGGNLIAPTDENIIFSKNWESRVAGSTFGRVHVGNEGDKAYFEFKGTRLAILTSDAYERNFDVYIDGVKMTSIEVADHDGVYGITYLTDKLTSGKHKVEIICTGEANIDSFAIFDEK